MRTRDEIDRDVEKNTEASHFLIDESLQTDKDFEVRRKSLETHAKELKKEIAYEDTLEGLIDNHVALTEKKVEALLDDLEQKTGVRLIIVRDLGT